MLNIFFCHKPLSFYLSIFILNENRVSHRLVSLQINSKQNNIQKLNPWVFITLKYHYLNKITPFNIIFAIQKMHPPPLIAYIPLVMYCSITLIEYYFTITLNNYIIIVVLENKTCHHINRK